MQEPKNVYFTGVTLMDLNDVFYLQIWLKKKVKKNNPSFKNEAVASSRLKIVILN